MHRQVPLAQMQYVGSRRESDVRPVVDRQQLAVPLAGVREHLQRGQLVRGLHLLLAELHDVHATGQCGIQELFEVALLLARIRAQVETGIGEPVGVVSHTPKPAMTGQT